jgi:hypothetical protein
MLDPRWVLEEGYRVERFDSQDAIAEQDVLDFWRRTGAVPDVEATRRVPEVLLVATTDAGELVGISSIRIKRLPRLHIDLWNYRAFVANEHRQSNVMVTLAVRGRDLLRRRYVGGQDPRAAGILYEIENRSLVRHFPEAVWPAVDFVFIGVNEWGAHQLVWYFPGALAPEPPR